MTMKKALTIAGSDTSGGAGLQADLKTFQERDVYGMTVLTTIVTMDPFNSWNHLVFPVDIQTVKHQFDTVLEGIGIDAAKTGMLGSVELIELVAQKVEQYKIEKFVVDPVMVCKGADEVMFPELAVALQELLVPKALVVTPNLFEASQLAKRPAIKSVDDMKECAARIQEGGAKYVLVKGGAKLGLPNAVDVFYDGKEFEVLEYERINSTYTHGAGCTTAAAITAELAKGATVQEAVQTAKAFITAAIKHGFPLNQYVGPTMHSAYRHFGTK